MKTFKPPHLRVEIDGNVFFDGTVGEWTTKPPDLFRDQIKPGVKPETHLMAVMLELADAVQRNQPRSITVTTNGTGYTMEVSKS